MDKKSRRNRELSSSSSSDGGGDSRQRTLPPLAQRLESKSSGSGDDDLATLMALLEKKQKETEARKKAKKEKKEKAPPKPPSRTPSASTRASLHQGGTDATVTIQQQTEPDILMDDAAAMLVDGEESLGAESAREPDLLTMAMEESLMGDVVSPGDGDANAARDTQDAGGNVSVHSFSVTGTDRERLLAGGGDSEASSVAGTGEAGEAPSGRDDAGSEPAVCFGLRYDYARTRLTVTVLGCRHLPAPPATRQNGKAPLLPDPYVKLYLLPDTSEAGKRKTDVVEAAASPEYRYTAQYTATRDQLEYRTLSVAVWHNDTFGTNRCLGEVLVDFDFYDFPDPRPQWHTLGPPRKTVFDEGCERARALMTYVGDVSLALKLVPGESGAWDELHVLLKGAKYLCINGACNPFCKVYLLPDRSESSRQKTKVARWSSSPSWQHTCVFPLAEGAPELAGRALELTVWNSDTLPGRSSFLGGVRLGTGEGGLSERPVLWNDAEGAEAAVWRRLLDSPGGTWVEAEIMLRASMESRIRPQDGSGEGTELLRLQSHDSGASGFHYSENLTMDPANPDGMSMESERRDSYDTAPGVRMSRQQSEETYKSGGTQQSVQQSTEYFQTGRQQSSVENYQASRQQSSVESFHTSTQLSVENSQHTSRRQPNLESDVAASSPNTGGESDYYMGMGPPGSSMTASNGQEGFVSTQQHSSTIKTEYHTRITSSRMESTEGEFAMTFSSEQRRVGSVSDDKRLLNSDGMRELPVGPGVDNMVAVPADPQDVEL